jgi:hypothetical protein
VGDPSDSDDPFLVLVESHVSLVFNNSTTFENSGAMVVVVWYFCWLCTCCS